MFASERVGIILESWKPLSSREEGGIKTFDFARGGFLWGLGQGAEGEACQRTARALIDT